MSRWTTDNLVAALPSGGKIVIERWIKFDKETEPEPVGQIHHADLYVG
jgi:hypothetical protein